MPSTPAIQHRIPTPNDKILNVLWQLKKIGRADATIKNISKCLYVLDRHADLDNPDSVVTFVATFDRKQGYKRNLIMAYEHYVKAYGLTWIKPKYHENAKMPKIPQEHHIDLIMANSPLKLRTAIAISKDTGVRPIELMRMTLRNFDLTNGAVYPETAKHGSPRVLKLKNSTLNLLNKYLASRNIGLNENVFGTWNSDIYGKWFRYYRNKTAEKMQAPTIKCIRLYDLRHYFATMTYHRTKDLLFTKQQMGHRKIETTLVYTQLLQFEKDDNYTCKVAKNVEEATELIESGFELVTEMEGLKLFRKRK
jgi:integrase